MLPVWSTALFFMYLLIWLFGPLFWPKAWEHPYTLFWISAPFAFTGIATMMAYAPSTLVSSIYDFARFFIMLINMVWIAEGIGLKNITRGTPWQNTLCLIIGSILASGIGTLACTLLMAQPFFYGNAHRQRTQHLTPFFIFTISNIGGLLTPLGDPPLYLGLLHGVPFTFPLQLWPCYGIAIIVLVVLFYIVDRRAFELDKHTVTVPRAQALKWDDRRFVNLLIITCSIHFMAGIGSIPEDGYLPLMLIPLFSALLLKPQMCGYLLTHGALPEIGILFFTLFATMPALWQHIAHLPLQQLRFVPRDGISFFWTTGLLSALLDNAPTYLTASSFAARLLDLPTHTLSELAQHPQGSLWLRAISAGAVMMGALTYIGNAPNLIVRHTAQKLNMNPPGFFTYTGIALFVLLPIFGVCSFCFLEQN
jgi:Na+/H+ antiporter NhaD/arsenite permease-like protein